MKHKHADLMIEYAKDWAETKTPWKRWECKDIANWFPLEAHPLWLSDAEYRRKPRTIKINGIEVPEPVREPLEEGHGYYIPIIGSEFLHIDFRKWTLDNHTMTQLKSGLIHLTAEAAFLHRKALISFTEVTK